MRRTPVPVDAALLREQTAVPNLNGDVPPDAPETVVIQVFERETRARTDRRRPTVGGPSTAIPFKGGHPDRTDRATARGGCHGVLRGLGDGASKPSAPVARPSGPRARRPAFLRRRDVARRDHRTVASPTLDCPPGIPLHHRSGEGRSSPPGPGHRRRWGCPIISTTAPTVANPDQADVDGDPGRRRRATSNATPCPSAARRSRTCFQLLYTSRSRARLSFRGVRPGRPLFGGTGRQPPIARRICNPANVKRAAIRPRRTQSGRHFLGYQIRSTGPRFRPPCRRGRNRRQ